MTRRTGPVLETGIFCSAMKKNINVMMLAIAAMAAFSCTIEIENPQEIKTFEPKVITVNTDNDVTPITKTSLSGVSVVWTDADAIKGYDGSSVHPSTAVAVSNEGKTAEFTFATVNVEDDLLYLAYPAESVTDIDDDFVYASIPATQDATANSFANGANVAVAEGLVAEPVFSNVGGLLSFIINDDNITSVKLSANESMTGAAKISMGAGTFAQPTITSGNEYVKVTGTIANGTTYYAVVYPGTYTGLKIEVTNSSGQVATFTNSNSMTVERNSIMHIATLSVPGGKWVTPTKGDEYSWSLESGDLGASATPAASATKGTPSKEWTLAPTWSSSGYFAWQADKGVQIGSAGSPCTSYILSTSEYDGYIQTIRVNFSQASSGAASVSVMVGGENLLCGGNAIKNATTSATSYDFTAASLLKGKVKICLTNTAAKAFYLKSIVINPDSRAAVTLSFDEDAVSILNTNYQSFLGQDVTASPNVTAITSNINWSYVDNDGVIDDFDDGVLTLTGTAGTASVTASFDGDENYRPAEKTYTINVFEPYTASEAYAAATTSEVEGVYVKGIVSEITTAYSPSNHNVSFTISDSGLTSGDQFTAYRTAAESADDVAVGDCVILNGTLIKYNNTTPELKQGNTIVSSLRMPAFVSGDANFVSSTSVTLSAADGATIYYTSDGTTPTTSSSVYSSAIPVSATTTIKAIAAKDGLITGVASKTFTKTSAYAITWSASSNGSIAVKHGDDELTSGDTIAAGETITIVPDPDSGYELSTLVYNDGSDHDIKAAKSFTMPSHAVSITATFAASGFSLALTFPDENNDNNKVNSYSNTGKVYKITYNTTEYSWSIDNFNNNNWSNSWTYIRGGAKAKTAGTAVTWDGSISTSTAISPAISEVVVNYGRISIGSGSNIGEITMAKLEVSTSSTFASISETVNGIPTTTGEYTYEIENPIENGYYRLSFSTSNKATSAGVIQIDSISYNL